ncbi:MAG: dodecin domain-containing protein [Methylophaga sp.]|nr:dodecin domain-containing protein [Methylophaga sp.]
MSSIARVTEVIARSTKSFDDAIQDGVARATETLENVTSVWIQDQTLDIKDNKIVGYKVAMKVTFILK